MADFTPINTQEELNRIIGDRILKAKESAASEYKTQLAERDQKITDFETKVSDLNKQIETLSANAGKITELEAKVREYESNSVKMRIARETGLPIDLADRITGADETAMREDAEMLAKLMKGQQPVAPMYTHGGDGGDGKDQALKSLLSNIRKDS